MLPAFVSCPTPTIPSIEKRQCITLTLRKVRIPKKKMAKDFKMDLGTSAKVFKLFVFSFLANVKNVDDGLGLMFNKAIFALASLNVIKV